MRKLQVEELEARLLLNGTDFPRPAPAGHTSTVRASPARTDERVAGADRGHLADRAGPGGQDRPERSADRSPSGSFTPRYREGTTLSLTGPQVATSPGRVVVAPAPGNTGTPPASTPGPDAPPHL